uniref:Uncharacterized protein n=1 Tax=Catharus ustulatus TaxID=91951 RepID=A0A8C3UU34_CATUS
RVLPLRCLCSPSPSPPRHFPAPTSGYCTPPSGAGSSPGAGREEPGFGEETGRLARAGMAGGWETLHCVPPLGYPEPYITWKKDGVTLDLVGGRYVVTKGKLQVASSQLGTAAATTFLHVREGQCGTSTITGPSWGSCKGIHLTGSI